MIRLLFALFLTIGQLLTADPSAYSSFAFAALIPLATAAIGALAGRGGRKRQNETNQNAINFLRELGDGTLEKGTEAWDVGFTALQSVIDSGGLSPELVGGLNDLNGFLTNLPTVPGQVVKLPSGIGDTSELGNAGLAAEGYGFEQLGVKSNQEIALMEGADSAAQRARTDPRLNVLGDFAENILRHGGRTDQTEDARKQFQSLLENFGQTPETRGMTAEGKKLLDSGGMTPELRELQGTFKQQIDAGGLTPEAKQLFGSLMEIVNSRGEGGALMPMEQALSFARDEAAQLASSTAEARQRQANARGSAPGTVAGSGLQNQALAESDSEILQAQSKGIRDTALQQQQLQLQQFLGASGVAGDVTRQGASIIASANTGLGDIARASSANIGTGAGLMQSAGQIGAANMGTAGTGLANIFNNELGRMNFAGDLSMDIEGQRRQLEQLAQGGYLGSAQVAQGRGQTGLQALGVPINAGLELRGQGVTERGQDVAQRGQDMDFTNATTNVQFRGYLASLGIYGEAADRMLSAAESGVGAAQDFFRTGLGAGQAQSQGANNFAQNPLGNNLVNSGVSGGMTWANQFLGGPSGNTSSGAGWGAIQIPGVGNVPAI